MATRQEMNAKMAHATDQYIEEWWKPISAARGTGKKVRLESDRMTLELRRAYEAGWRARNEDETI